MKKLVFIIFIVFTSTGFAQPWMYDEGGNRRTNFFEIQAAFNNYWGDKPYEKGQGYKQYKRWEDYWSQRVDSDGNFPPKSLYEVQKEYEKMNLLKQDVSRGVSRANGPWEYQGPYDSEGDYGGIGRVNCVAFHPSLQNTFWIGSPAGGIWKTTDGGSTWTPLSDKITRIGVSSIAIDYNNPNTIYIATGDKDGNDTYSIGVLKSTDGGTTWLTTGLQFSVSQLETISKLLIHPSNPSILIAATTDGMYKTSNGGTTWSRTQSGTFFDAEFKPTDPATVYSASTSGIHKSTNTGDSWTLTYPITSFGRIDLAVTAANSSVVEAVVTNQSGGGLKGLYKSTNSGSSFSKYWDGTTNGNLLHSTDVNSSGGQGWYDLTLCISPTNANLKFVGGVNTMKTTNGGSSWTYANVWSSYWFPSVNAQEVHADKHYMIYHPLNTSTVFECNDGGIYKSTNNGSSWTDLSDGLHISQIYRMSLAKTSSKVIVGLQDNGTKYKNTSGTYADVNGGDGMDCAIDPTNSNIQYSSVQYGKFKRTSNNWSSSVDITPSSQQGAWVTPIAVHPTTPTTIYIGYQQLYRSTNSGTSWTSISNFLSGNDLHKIEISQSSPSTMYVSDYSNLYKTTNGGTSWTTVSLPSAANNIHSIHISPNNSSKVWITTKSSSYILSAGGYGQIYESTNGGSSWTNITSNLPSINCNDIISNNNDADLYVATDIGVYYKPSSGSSWSSFTDNLPNTVVNELEIRDNQIYAATYGRGLWSRNLIELDCSNATVISCGQSVSGTTAGETNAISSYSNCGTGQNEAGPEKIYSLTISNPSNITATLSGMSVDLDIHILSACSGSSCVARDDISATYSNAPAGTYYIVVDGYNGAEGAFTLSVTCDTATGPPSICANATVVNCGQLYSNQTNAGGTNNISTYSCGTQNESGPEKIYKITTTSTGTISAALSNTSYQTGDVDVHILSSCNENACVARGDLTATYSNAPAGDYYIIVDGYQGATGPFDITVTCNQTTPNPTDLDCTNATPINCGATVNGTTSNSVNNASSYPNCNSQWDESGMEKIYRLDITSTQDIRIELSNLSVDLDIFLLDACSKNNCVAVGNDTILYQNATPGTYYIVVDGYQGVSGAFTLSVQCSGQNTPSCTSTPISCGQTISSTTVGEPNIHNAYSCDYSYHGGGEKIFQLTTTSVENIVASLSNMTVDLDVFILTSLCDSSSCYGYGDNSVTYANAPAGTYYIVVDGKNTANGSFTLNIACNSFAQYTINTYSSPSQGGNVTGGGTYVAGNNVTLVASPQPCWEFTQWMKNGILIPAPTGTNSIYSFSATENVNITALFQRKTHTINLTATPNGISSEAGGGIFNCGDTITVTTSVVDNSYHFVDWKEAGVTQSPNQNYTFVVTGDRNLVAYYSQTASIIEQDITDKIRISPNPTSGELTIESISKGIESIQIFDMNGKLIESYHIGGIEKRIGIYISTYSDGIYQLRILDSEGILYNSKIVKQ